jgi:prefoldin subunit 5
MGNTMSENDNLRRIDKLEEEISKLSLTISELSTSIAILNRIVENMNEAESRRAALKDKTILIAVGGFISAIVAWIIKGGLAQ